MDSPSSAGPLQGNNQSNMGNHRTPASTHGVSASPTATTPPLRGRLRQTGFTGRPALAPAPRARYAAPPADMMSSFNQYDPSTPHQHHGPYAPASNSQYHNSPCRSDSRQNIAPSSPLQREYRPAEVSTNQSGPEQSASGDTTNHALQDTQPTAEIPGQGLAGLQQTRDADSLQAALQRIAALETSVIDNQLRLFDINNYTNKQCKNIEETLDSLNLSSRIENYETRLKTFETTYSDTQNQRIDAMRVNLEERFNMLASRVDKADRELEQIEPSITSINSAVTEHSIHVAGRVGQLEKEVSALQQMFETFEKKQQDDTTDKRIETLEASLRRLQCLEKLHADFDEFKVDVDCVRLQNAENQKKMASEVSDLRTELARTAGSIPRFDKRIDDLNVKIVSAAASIIGLEEGSVTAHVEALDSTIRVEAIDSRVSHLKERHEIVACNLDSHVRSNAKERQEIHDDVKSNYARLSASLEDARKQRVVDNHSLAAFQRLTEQSLATQTKKLEEQELLIKALQAQEFHRQQGPAVFDMPIGEAIRSMQALIPTVPSSQAEAGLIFGLMHICMNSFSMFNRGTTVIIDDCAVDGAGKSKQGEIENPFKSSSPQHDAVATAAATAIDTPAYPISNQAETLPATVSSSKAPAILNAPVQEVGFLSEAKKEPTATIVEKRDVYDFNEESDDGKHSCSPRRSDRPKKPKEPSKGFTTWKAVGDQIDLETGPKPKKRRRAYGGVV